jgi:hypothetical protein
MSVRHEVQGPKHYSAKEADLDVWILPRHDYANSWLPFADDGNSKVRRRAQWRRTSHSHATHSGAALTERAPPCRRVSMCCATSSGAAPYSAAPP